MRTMIVEVVLFIQSQLLSGLIEGTCDKWRSKKRNTTRGDIQALYVLV